MDANELQEARTNPDFLKFLSEKEENAKATKNLKELYEVLDTMLILDLDVSRVDSVYENILQLAFERVEQTLASQGALDLQEDGLYVARAIYEYAIENWSNQNYGGAKGIFYILNSIINDENLNNSLIIHIISVHNEETLDSFYTKIDHEEQNSSDIYGYFITRYNFDTTQYLQDNAGVVQEINLQIQSMMG